nr:MAG TPA: hypothetical protein [Caudoviricetes sp.]
MLLRISAMLYFQRSLFMMTVGCLKYFKIFILISL